MDGIIFDVDGTIWDATELIGRAWGQAVKENSDLHIEVTEELLSKLFGKTMEDIWATLFPELTLDEQTALGALCTNYENRALETKGGVPYEGIQEVITTLAKTHKIYVVSNCQKGYIPLMLKRLGLEHCISDHLCYGDTLLPKSQTIRLLMERNNLKDVAYIGDTATDYAACKEVGIPFIFVEYGFGDAPEATTRVKQARELLDLLVK